MRSIPKDTLSLSRIAAHIGPTGISKAGMIAAAKILGLRIAGDLLHLPKAAESDFFKEAELATQMIESQNARLNRETQ